VSSAIASFPAGTSGSSPRTCSSAWCGGQEQELGVDAIEREPQLVLVGDADDGLEPELRHLADELLEPAVVVLEPFEADEDGVGAGGVAERVGGPEDRELGGVAEARRLAAHDDPLGARLLGGARAVGVTDRGEKRDPVPLGDGLAEATRGSHRAGGS
jgi:hypothetical protein